MAEPSFNRADGRFVYGMTVLGLNAVAELTFAGANAVATPGGPDIVVRVERSDGQRRAVHALDAHRSVESVGAAHQWVLERASFSARLVGPPLDPDLLAHPCLAPVAVAFNRWAGRESFHAASFAVGGRAYGVIGPRTAGKSTLVAGLAAAGTTVLSDDIVITDGRNAFAGPRCVDLRAPIPGLDISTVSARLGTRWRLRLSPAPASLPLGGWIFLSWGDDVSIRRCPPREVIARLTQWRGRRVLASDPTVVLDLVARPAWELTRPRDWSRFDDVSQILTRTLDPRVSELSR